MNEAAILVPPRVLRRFPDMNDRVNLAETRVERG